MVQHWLQQLAVEGGIWAFDTMAAIVKNKISAGAGRFRQPLVSGAHRGEILVDDRRRAAAPLTLISQQAPDEPDVRRRVEVDLKIEQGGEIAPAEKMGAFDHHNGGWGDGSALRKPAVAFKIVARGLNRPARAKRLEVAA